MGKQIWELYIPETSVDNSEEISSELSPTISSTPKPCECGCRRRGSTRWRF